MEFFSSKIETVKGSVFTLLTDSAIHEVVLKTGHTRACERRNVERKPNQGHKPDEAIPDWRRGGTRDEEEAREEISVPRANEEAHRWLEDHSR